MLSISNLLYHRSKYGTSIGYDGQKLFRIEKLRKPHALKLLGTLDLSRIRKLFSANLRYGKVYVHEGVIDHINFNHSGIFTIHENRMAKMIEQPDFVGINPREAHSLELYIKEGHLIIGIKYDCVGQYSFLASMYELDGWDYKMHNRLKSQRIKCFN